MLPVASTIDLNTRLKLTKFCRHFRFGHFFEYVYISVELWHNPSKARSKIIFWNRYRVEEALKMLRMYLFMAVMSIEITIIMLRYRLLKKERICSPVHVSMIDKNHSKNGCPSSAAKNFAFCWHMIQ